MQHWLWIIPAILFIGWFLWSRQGAKGIEMITPGELQTRLKQKPQSLHIIDVREPYEFQGGHIARAKNIPLGSVKTRLGDMPEGKDVVFVCRSGNRSLRAAKMAKSAGLSSVYNLSGGMMRWSGPVKR